MSTQSCIFCRIARGEIPSSLLHDDGEIFAIRDISPIAPTHILVIPKAHVPTLNESDGSLVGRMVDVAKKLARDEGIAERGYRLVVNTQREAGQEVFHLHLHLIGGRSLKRMG